MALFLDKLKAITQVDSTELTNTQLVYNLQSGANFVYMSVPQELLSSLETKSIDIVDGNGYQLSNTWHVTSVIRDGKTAIEVDPRYKYFLSYDGSIYKATKFFPKYYILDSKVFIEPEPTSAEIANVYYIKPPIITDSTDTSTVTYSMLSNIILNYASALTFTSLANIYSHKSTSDSDIGTADIDDAIDKAKNLIDDHANAGGDTLDNSVQSYLSDEDTELAVATIQAAQQEVQRAIALIQNAGTKNKVYSQESQVYFQKAEAYFKLASEELKEYIGANPKWISFNAELAKQQGYRR